VSSRLAAVRLIGVLAVAALAGAVAARASGRGAALALAVLTAYAVAMGRAVGRAQRVESAARDELRATVAARTAEREKRGAELAASVRQLDVARAHLGVTDRLAVVGRLAGGVAHEVNNTLAIAVTNIGWVRERLEASMTGGEGAAATPEELVAALREAEEATLRMARTVRDLQEFAHGGPSAGDPGPAPAPVRRSGPAARAC
jgi:C4-dicarboxylate-specific signal transduction histidine kinase